MVLIFSWNVWGMPFDSKRLFARQHKWGKFAADQINQRHTDNDDLRVACFQEAWGFRAGLLGA